MGSDGVTGGCTVVVGGPQCWVPLPPRPPTEEVRVVMVHRTYSAAPPLGRSECPDQGRHGSSWFARLHLLTRVCSCTDMPVCVSVHTCTCPHASAGSCGREHAGAHMHLRVSACVPVCLCVYRHMCRCTHSHVCPMCAACLHACVCARVRVWSQRILPHSGNLLG